MDELAALLNRLKNLDEQKDANAKAINHEQERLMREENLPLKETAAAYLRARENVGKDFTNEILKELQGLLPIYLDLPPDKQATVKRVITACGHINWALVAYVTYAAHQIKGPADINWLKNALAAVLLDGNNLEQGRAFQQPLEQLYISAYEADLNPDKYIATMLSIFELNGLRYIQKQFSHSDKFKRLTVKKPGQVQLIKQLEALFAKDIQTLLADLMDLSNKQDIWDNGYAKELSRLMSKEHQPYTEASKLAQDMMGPGYVNPMFEKLDSLCPAYIEMNVNQRGVIKTIVHTHQALLHVMAGYTERAASQLTHQPDPNLLRYALAAAAIEDGGIDFRDTLMSLGNLYKAAYNAGLHPDPYYKKLGEQLGSAYLSTFTESAHYLKDVKPTLNQRPNG
jgi:hypothetical protein